MIIDLASPLWGSIAAGIILMIIAGTYHYIITLIKLNFTDKKLSNVLSEIDTLHKNYKKEITEIKKKHGDELTSAIEHALDIYGKKIDELLKHNQPPYSGSSNKLRDLYLSGRHAKSNKTS